MVRDEDDRDLPASRGPGMEDGGGRGAQRHHTQEHNEPQKTLIKEETITNGIAYILPINILVHKTYMYQIVIGHTIPNTTILSFFLTEIQKFITDRSTSVPKVPCQ